VKRIEWTDVALLLLRMAGLLLAVNHGWGKVQALATGEGEGFVNGVAGLGFPLPVVFAWSAALSEFAGGLLVALGLGTRIAAGFAASTMFVAAFIRHKALQHLLVWIGVLSVSEETQRSWGNPEAALVFLIVFLAVAVLGGGRFALDRIVRRR